MTKARVSATIYVELLDEGVEVWRLVTAEVLDGGRYRILSENVSPDDEQWAFVTGDVVHCERQRFDDGSIGYVATRRAV